MRTIGVEEEFLLVDALGRPRPLAEPVVAVARRQEHSGPAARDDPNGDGADGADRADGADGDGADGGREGAEPGGIEHELQLEQAETSTPPTADAAELLALVADGRRTLADAARARGGGLAALGTSPLPVTPTPTPSQRYLTIMREYGVTAHEQLTCGCHVHVDIASRAEGVAVIAGIGPWLPVVAALAANSPFWQGEDTGYASYRRMVYDRWPGAGPTQPFADEAEYDAAVAALVRSGVLLDDAMIYFDARLSARFPTVEVRVADVQPEAADTVLVATLVRALVDTAAAPPPGGFPRPRLELMRGASWRAARSGLSGTLVDAVRGTAVPALDMVQGLVDHVRPALRSNGDLSAVEASLARLVARGTGADLQRASYRRRRRLADVVADAVARTAPS